MWFKYAAVFNLTEVVEYKPEELAEDLAEFAFQPCGKVIPMSMGWAAPLDIPGAPLVHAANGNMLLCLKIAEKLLPPAVIKEVTDEKIVEMEQAQDRKLSRREKLSIKDETYFHMLPQAFCKSQRLYAYIDTKNNWLVVNTTSKKKLESFTNLFMKIMPTQNLTPLPLKSPAKMMTKWLANNSYPSNFAVGDSCVLQDPRQEGATVRCNQQDLLSENIQSFLADGDEVIQMKLTWAEKIAFTFKQDATISSIQFTDIIKDLAKDNYAETEAQRFDADFVIMSETLRQLLEELYGLLIDTNSPSEAAMADERELAEV